MRLASYYIYNTKTLKKVQTIGVDKEKAIKELNKLPNTECYAIGMKWFNL